MIIVVKTLTGNELKVDVEPSDPILKIKELVEQQDGIPPSQQRLVFLGKQISDDQTVEACGLKSGSQLNLVLSLRGGC